MARRLDLPPRIHVMGLGSIGSFTALALSEMAKRTKRPIITLLMHRKSLMETFQKRGSQIILQENNGNRIYQDGFDAEFYHDNSWHAPSHNNPVSSVISHLVLTVKTPQTVAALRLVKPRLTSRSTILFLQNGCGMVEAVNEELYPDPGTRPNYITGVISHGVYMLSPFEILHSGPAMTSIGAIPREHPPSDPEPPEGESELDETPSYMLDIFPRAGRLKATSYPYTEVFQLQLEKLAVNSFTNPNAALFDKSNSVLVTIPETRDAFVREISAVARAMPELQGVPGVQERFSTERLTETVNKVVAMNIETVGSMVWDVRRKQKTEIEFINGYWAKRGRELGIKTPALDEIIEKIKEKERSYLSSS